MANRELLSAWAYNEKPRLNITIHHPHPYSNDSGPRPHYAHAVKHVQVAYHPGGPLLVGHLTHVIQLRLAFADLCERPGRPMVRLGKSASERTVIRSSIIYCKTPAWHHKLKQKTTEIQYCTRKYYPSIIL